MSNLCGSSLRGDVVVAVLFVAISAFIGYFAAELSKVNMSLVLLMVPVLITTLSLTFYVPYSIFVYFFRAGLNQRNLGIRSMFLLTTEFASLLTLSSAFVNRANYEIFITLGPIGFASTVILGGFIATSLSIYTHLGVSELPKIIKFLIHFFVITGLVSFWVIVAVAALSIATFIALVTSAQWDYLRQYLDLTNPLGLTYFTISITFGAIDYLYQATSSRNQRVRHVRRRYYFFRTYLHELLRTLMVRYVIYLPDDAYQATVQIIDLAIKASKYRRNK
ncbi:MAG: hypothetical protein QW067_08895 [Thermofilaceae archaeon]